MERSNLRTTNSILIFFLVSLFAVPGALAGKDTDLPKSVKDLKDYKFVDSGNDDERKMQIVDKKHGVIGGKTSGFIKYRVASWKGKEIIQINMIEGVKGIKGVGEALKKELLRQHSSKSIRSDLVHTNRSKLLRVWAKGYPHSSSDKNGELFRGVVPALKFEGFDYTIYPVSRGIGGRVELEMEAARKGHKGTIKIVDPLALDKILVTTEPELIRAKDRPKSEKEEKNEKREDEASAKKSGDFIEKLAKKVSKAEGVSRKDLLKHLWKVMDSECGRGGSSGSGWANGCMFIRKSSSYQVKARAGRATFYLGKRIEAEAEEFVEDNK